MTVRSVEEPHEAECESKLRKYGFILTYGVTSPNVKVAGANEYPVGVTLQPTKKFDGTITSSVRVAYAKTGLVKIFKRAGVASILQGDGVTSDASGCATRFPATKFAAQSFCAQPYRSLVGIAEERIATAASGLFKVYLTIHTTPKP